MRSLNYERKHHMMEKSNVHWCDTCTCILHFKLQCFSICILVSNSLKIISKLNIFIGECFVYSSNHELHLKPTYNLRSDKYTHADTEAFTNTNAYMVVSEHELIGYYKHANASYIDGSASSGSTYTYTLTRTLGEGSIFFRLV